MNGRRIADLFYCTKLEKEAHMSTAILLNVNGNMKTSTEINYDDLVWLYEKFIADYGYVPRTNECIAKNNLPQGRIVSKVLRANNITYNEFMLQLGKKLRVRTESSDYSVFVEKYKAAATLLGRTIKMKELKEYGLPAASWYVKYCPDDNVDTYKKFLIWCGYNIDENTKDSVSVALIQLEKELDRPITRCDITPDNVGFSMIVINRIWGSLGECKKDLGLLETLPSSRPKSFEYYRDLLDDILSGIKKSTDRRFISWKDIECDALNLSKTEHRTFIKSFKSVDLDIYAYIKSKGFMMNPSGFSFHYTFDDGEKVVSSFEYDFSQFLRENGYVYNDNYRRDVLYRSFIPNISKRKINCDYMIIENGMSLYIEIVGIVDKNWETTAYQSKQENNYKRKMQEKKELLNSNRIPYLFLYPEDFRSGEYKEITMKFLKG